MIVRKVLRRNIVQKCNNERCPTSFQSRVLLKDKKVDKKVYKSYYSRRRKFWNFRCPWYTQQRALEFTITLFEAYGQKATSTALQHFDPLGIWSGLQLRRFTVHFFLWARKLSTHDIHWQLWKCMAMLWRPGNRLPDGAACLSLAWTIIWMTIEGDDKLPWLQKATPRIEEPIQRITCKFAAYGIGIWFILRHCAAYRGGCTTVL
jgi:hypothetical protein